MHDKLDPISLAAVREATKQSAAQVKLLIAGLAKKRGVYDEDILGALTQSKEVLPIYTRMMTEANDPTTEAYKLYTQGRTEVRLKQCFDFGWEAELLGIPLEKNPFEGEDAKAYMNGWVAAEDEGLQMMGKIK